MQQSNNQTNEQQMSQLMDGEWLELNPTECVAALCKDEALQAKWSRYHMIRDVMKNEPVSAEFDLSSRISAAIEDEPTYSNITSLNATSDAKPFQSAASETNVTSIQAGKSSADNKSMFKTGLTGFAMAASVALVTVVGMNIWQAQGTDQPSSVASTSLQNDGSGVFVEQVEGATLPVVEFVSNTGSFWVSPETTERVRDEQRLNMMLSKHFENSPTSNREGLLPYSRLVGYDERGLEQ